MAASAAARQLTARIRENVLGILLDTWPMPWATPYLQAAFGHTHYMRVYNALTRLWDQGLVAKFPEQRWNYWVAIGDPVGPPPCRCGRPVTEPEGRVIFWYGHGGWWCGGQDHYEDIIEQEWPWPKHDELISTLATW